VNEVNLLFIATDKHGKFVRDLNQGDFTFWTITSRLRRFLTFAAKPTSSAFGLVIDVSGSVNSRFAFEQDAATSFLQHTLRAGFDKAFVVGSTARVHMAQDFTDNVQLLSAGVQQPARRRRDGALQRHLPRVQRKVFERSARSSDAQKPL
jgi:hypothetical protein